MLCVPERTLKNKGEEGEKGMSSHLFLIGASHQRGTQMMALRLGHPQGARGRAMRQTESFMLPKHVFLHSQDRNVVG